MIRDSIKKNNPIKIINRRDIESEPGVGVIDVYFSYEQHEGRKVIKLITNCSSDLIRDFGNALAKLNKDTSRLPHGVISIWSSTDEIGPFQTKRFLTKDDINLSSVDFHLEDHLQTKPDVCYRAVDFENYGRITRLIQHSNEDKSSEICDDDIKNNENLLTSILYDRHNTLWKSFNRWSLNTSIRSLKWSIYAQKGYLTNKRSRVSRMPFDLYIKCRSKPYDIIDETKETITLLFDGFTLNLRKRRYKFQLMNSIEHIPEWKVNSNLPFDGMEKNIISCLKNLYKLEGFPKNDDNYYIRNGRSFILLKKVGNNAYSEINTKILRIVENLKMCEHYEKTLVGFFKRTKYPIKPYGRLYYNLVNNYKHLPSNTYSEAVQMSLEDVKKHFWCKIYHKNDKRNRKENHSRIIKNPCWNYTKFISVNTYYFDQELILNLDKSRRTVKSNQNSTLSYDMTREALERKNEFRYGYRHGYEVE